MRRCPRCESALRVALLTPVEVDQCRHCGRAFLDAGEAAYALGPEAEAPLWMHEPEAKALGANTLACPRAHGTLSAYQVGAGEQRVIVDVCAHCHGIWLDHAEGKRLRGALRGVRERLDEQPPAGARVGLKWYLFQLLSGLPVEVWNPRRRLPVATLTLIALCVAVFAAQIALVVEDDLEAFARLFGLVPAQLLRGETPWALLTNMFLHGGFPHLVGNMYFLYLFGDNVEDHLGSRRFVWLFVLAGVVGGLAHVATHPNAKEPAAGASGAIAGVMGCYLMLFPRAKLWLVVLFIRFKLSVLWFLLAWIVFQLFMAYQEIGALMETHVGWFAHSGGFFTGVAFGWAHTRKLRQAVA